jgi:pilus assembly protein CpaB
MSVKVNEVIGVAGFVVPGTRVDVLAIVREGRDNNTMTRAVVSNVQVLTAGTRYDQEKSRDGEPIPSTVVTLMVTPDDAERIALASAEGRIMLTLRNPLDMEPTETRGIRMTALMAPANPPPVQTNVGGRRVVTPRPPAQAPPVSSIYTVETIRAAKRTEEVVR